MSFPPGMYSAGEEVIVETRHHWTYLSCPVLVFVSSLTALITAATLMPESWNSVLRGVILAIAAILFVLATFISGLRYLKWHRTRLIVTNLRVIYWCGSLKMSGLQLKVGMVANTRAVQNSWERLLGVGEFHVQSMVGGHVRRFSFVPSPHRVQQEMLKMRRSAGAPTSSF